MSNPARMGLLQDVADQLRENGRGTLVVMTGKNLRIPKWVVTMGEFLDLVANDGGQFDDRDEWKDVEAVSLVKSS